MMPTAMRLLRGRPVARFLCGFGWEWSAEPSGERAAAGIAALRQFTADLEAARLAASQEDDELGEVPDEFLDPITMELMAVSRRKHSTHSFRADRFRDLTGMACRIL